MVHVTWSPFVRNFSIKNGGTVVQSLPHNPHLPRELWKHVLDCLEDEDALSASLVCRQLHSARLLVVNHNDDITNETHADIRPLGALLLHSRC